jgi:hypothetical protein
MNQVDINEAPAVYAHSASYASLVGIPLTADRFAQEVDVPRDTVTAWQLDDGDYQYEADMVPGVPMMKVFAVGQPV